MTRDKYSINSGIPRQNIQNLWDECLRFKTGVEVVVDFKRPAHVAEDVAISEGGNRWSVHPEGFKQFQKWAEQIALESAQRRS